MCHPIAGREEEDTILDLTCLGGRTSPAASRVTAIARVEAKGVLGGVSSSFLGG